MTAILVLLHLGGAVALLLWATRMVRTGVERVCGRYLKSRLRHYLRNPFYAVAFGLVMAVMLQSSTAVTLLVGSFVGSGFVSATIGLMAVRGGELGSALVVKILSFNLTALVPLLLIFGTMSFLMTERRSWRQIGRIVVGIALLILSLDMTAQATAPLRDSVVLPAIISYLASDLLSSFLLAACLTYLFHSSIAGIILIASFANHGLMSSQLAVVMVLGVNFGSSVIAPMLTRASAPEHRLVPLGNLLMRGAGSLVMLGFVSFFSLDMDFLGQNPVDRVVHAHILFNLVIMLFGMGLSQPVFALTQKIVAIKTPPVQVGRLYPFSQTALDMHVLGEPILAIASARREVVRMSDLVDTMLEKTSTLYTMAERTAIAEVGDLAKMLDRRHEQLKQYLADLGRPDLDKTSMNDVEELLDVSIKLQQIGYIISHSILEAAKEMLTGKTRLEQGDVRDLEQFYAKVMANARLAFYVLLSHDITTAGTVVREKEQLRYFDRHLRQKHFERLQKGQTNDMRASTLYLDLLHDLKQINALLTSIAYPVLEEQGMLTQTRLRTF